MNAAIITTRSKNACSVDVNRAVRSKSQKSKLLPYDSITSEEALRKLQSLLPGDAFLIRYWCICGLPEASSAMHHISTRRLTNGEYIQGQFIKWLREDMTEYLILELPGCGRLQFKYGDVYMMVLSRKIIIGNLDSLQDDN
ncbi:hypothetical protein BMR1_03g04320 [Babesia microti strain RI]|uniref:Uncharacterized protein n=1 Tax=Babesia microti (strain RI) TaxID=1133968 RepID=A0A1R4ACP0_BABMR|nr:hypothetical protein BMR1_03g04320 [Babesia microti strain RI]SJK86664.1 hypothetical protein BMR1_03g04320 [Babesia microti strain RI]|eukprot:XP_021338794.1 hypothetical protein BMR1_03g04320 [Babesia microti strain RI]